MSADASPEIPITIVHALRRRWKPTKDRLAADGTHEDIRTRLHRCLSWMARIEEVAASGVDAHDMHVVHGWVALNALYGRWDAQRREPAPDWSSFEDFSRTVFDHDHDRRLATLLRREQALAERIVGNPFITRHFWRDPEGNEDWRQRKAVRQFREELDGARFRAAHDRVLERVYLLRCQLVHGAATYGGTVNREPVHDCAVFLDRLLPEIVTIIIDHAWHAADWSNLCYPPIT